LSVENGKPFSKKWRILGSVFLLKALSYSFLKNEIGDHIGPPTALYYKLDGTPPIIFFDLN